MWTPLRKEIEQIRKEQEIPENDFQPVGLSQWQEIEEKIYHTFCKLAYPAHRPGWLWEFFRQDTFGGSFHYPFEQLSRLVNSSEKVWLFINETVTEREKFWFYEGYIKAIELVLAESLYIDEAYIASKKYEWLICINHHDVLIATGKDMPEKLRKLSRDIP
jgi:hypothetical protein